MEPNHGRIVFSLMPKVMDADIRGVLIALIIVIVVFAVGTAVIFFGLRLAQGPWCASESPRMRWDLKLRVTAPPCSIAGRFFWNEVRGFFGKIFGFFWWSRRWLAGSFVSCSARHDRSCGHVRPVARVAVGAFGF